MSLINAKLLIFIIATESNSIETNNMTKITILSSDGYISIREAADKYYYSLKHIRHWIKKRKVKAFKHARKWYVHEPSLIQWINNNQ